MIEAIFTECAVPVKWFTHGVIQIIQTWKSMIHNFFSCFVENSLTVINAVSNFSQAMRFIKSDTVAS